jgi:putative phosphoesterase
VTDPSSFRIGLISDTHGLLRPEAVGFLRGADHIVHAGDVGSAAILEALGALAPVSAVRGNNDTAAWAAQLPLIERLRIGGLAVLLVHELAELQSLAGPVGEPPADIVVYGHSHQPRILEQAGRLCVNPGSAGPRRFKLPIAAGEILIEAGGSQVRLVDLTSAPPRELYHTLIGSHNLLI